MRKFLKYFLVLFALFATVSLSLVAVSATDDIDILYVGASAEYAVYQFPESGTVTVDGVEYNYRTTKILGYAEGSWTEPSQQLTDIANANRSYGNFDIVYFDMVNIYKGDFIEYAANAADMGKLLVATQTGYNACYMPYGFAIRDTDEFSKVYPVFDENYDITSTSENPFYNESLTKAFFENFNGEKKSEKMVELLVNQYVVTSDDFKTYRFFLQKDDEARWISGVGDNPVPALRHACLVNGIELDISDNGWITTMGGFGSVEEPPGTWSYWILFERDVENNSWVYSSKTIANLPDDDYFAFVYGATDGMTFEPLSTPEKPSKGHMVFSGYYTDSTLNNEYNFSVLPKKDMKLYVDWAMPTDFKYPVLVEEDGKTKHDITDVISFLQYVSGIGNFAGVSEEKMIEKGFDFNCDSKIDIIDVIIYLKGL
ncbi:MAG: InlB B-repeat-containing protein [Methanosarcinaceae archaeon]|nr:InlB B-repeat-containing protein [Methanosarcinaceae archaeon]